MFYMPCGKWVGVREDGKEEINWKSGALQVGLRMNDVVLEQGPESGDGKKWRNQVIFWRVDQLLNLKC